MRASFIIAVILFLTSILSVAQSSQKDQPQKGRDIVPISGAQTQTLPGSAKRYALVIGVDKYEDTQITSLGGASNDAQKLAEALVLYAGFPKDQVILLASDQPAERQPTRGNILRRLSNLAGVVPKDGMLLIFFAGHGIERGGQAFLLPSDAQVSNDVNLLEETAISASRVRERVKQTAVNQVIIILDACRNDPGGRANADNPLTEAYTRGFNFDRRNSDVRAFATIYATEVGHRAYEFKEKRQGYFTFELVEALKGGAANDNGEVTLQSLVRYLQQEVPKHVRIDLGEGKEQKPFAIIEGYKADELVVAKAAAKLQPKGSKEAAKSSSGVLFVLTDPPTAQVAIKEGSKSIKQGQSQNSEFRTELPPGDYSIEVSSASYLPYSGKATVKLEREEIVRAKLTPTTGSILVAPVEEGTSILIDGQKPDQKNLSIDKTEKQIELLNVPAGSHTIRITAPNIVPWEKKVEVQGGAKTPVAALLKNATVSLVVKSEPGTDIYIDGSYKGQVAETGQTGILEINPGEHTIKGVKQEYAPSEQTQKFTAGNATLDLKLSRVAFSPEFSDYFLEGVKFWTIPGSWQTSRGKVVVRGPGLGLIRDKLYKDFRLEFDISFANGKGAAWVVRANEKDYYLFQLSGPKGKSPNTFQTYISKNGKIQLLKTDAVAEDLSKPNDSYHIIVEAKGDVIKHSIQVSSAPKSDGPQPLATLSDNTYSYGTIGFTTIDGEEAVLYFVNVTPIS